MAVVTLVSTVAAVEAVSAETSVVAPAEKSTPAPGVVVAPVVVGAVVCESDVPVRSSAFVPAVPVSAGPVMMSLLALAPVPTLAVRPAR